MVVWTPVAEVVRATTQPACRPMHPFERIEEEECQRALDSDAVAPTSDLSVEKPPTMQVEKVIKTEPVIGKLADLKELKLPPKVRADVIVARLPNEEHNCTNAPKPLVILLETTLDERQTVADADVWPTFPPEVGNAAE